MKQANACTYISTTGTGIAIGTNMELIFVARGSDLAGTITIAASAGALFTISASQFVLFPVPVAINGPVTMTSSAGDHFVVGFRARLS